MAPITNILEVESQVTTHSLYLLDQLQDPSIDSETRQGALIGLTVTETGLGDAAVLIDAIVTALDDPDREVAVLAEAALSTVGRRSIYLLTRKLAALPEGSFSRTVARILGEVKASVMDVMLAVPGAAEFWGEDCPAVIQKLIESDDLQGLSDVADLIDAGDELGLRALWVLESIGARTLALTHLLRLIEAPNAKIRVWATTWLGDFGLGAVEPLAGILLDDEEALDVKLAAAGALGWIVSPRSVMVLADVIADNRYTLVTEAACRSLERLCKVSAYARPLQMAILGNTNREFLDAEKELTSMPWLYDDYMWALASGCCSPAVRARVAEVIGEIADPASIPVLMSQLVTRHSHDFYVCRQALEALAKMGDDQARGLAQSLAVLDIGSPSEQELEAGLFLVDRYVNRKMAGFLGQLVS